MKYVGPLYGKIGRKCFDTGKTSADWDAMEERISRLEFLSDFWERQTSAVAEKYVRLQRERNEIVAAALDFMDRPERSSTRQRLSFLCGKNDT